MKLAQHIKIGRTVLDNVLEKEDAKIHINRIAYLLGCMAPDINCVYPMHRLKDTEKRFYKRIRTCAVSHFDLLRSFALGVVTHYVCDYFVYAHNNDSSGLKHKIYEDNLYAYYLVHLNELENSPKELIDAWSKNKAEVVDGVFDEDLITHKEQCNMIVQQVKAMSDEYTKHIQVNRREGWEQIEEQMEYDLNYIMFIAQNIVNMIVEPFKYSTTII